MKIKSQRDFWAGLMFITFGLFFVAVAVGTPEFIDKIFETKVIPGYQIGSAVRMGPAYFPIVLGGLLAFLGALVLIDSLAEEGPPVAKFHFRPLLFILISSLAFAYLLKPLGLVLASIALVFISAYGGHEFKWKEVAILSVVLVIFSVLVFVKALVLPFPICPDFIERCPIQ
ncbi:MAG: tripartite tricarboxylate transporter TctB family protein [Betaproteobacteria bacterium]|nr:tripartite tricarboxylate transporter TctB family protein [Betaproteobacteria bacterium]